MLVVLCSFLNLTLCYVDFRDFISAEKGQKAISLLSSRPKRPEDEALLRTLKQTFCYCLDQFGGQAAVFARQ